MRARHRSIGGRQRETERDQIINKRLVRDRDRDFSLLSSLVSLVHLESLCLVGLADKGALPSAGAHSNRGERGAEGEVEVDQSHQATSDVCNMSAEEEGEMGEVGGAIGRIIEAQLTVRNIAPWPYVSRRPAIERCMAFSINIRPPRHRMIPDLSI